MYAAAMLSIFQAFSGDRQFVLFWASMQAEPVRACLHVRVAYLHVRVAYLHVRVYLSTDACTCISICVCMYVCIYIRMHECMNV
jgi:hypothetical protein